MSVSEKNSVLFRVCGDKQKSIFDTDTSDVIFFIIIPKYHCLFISFFCRLHNSSSLNPFEMNLESVICPYKQFHTIATVITKRKNDFIHF